MAGVAGQFARAGVAAAAVAAAAVGARPVLGQITLTTLDVAVVEHFDGLASAGVSASLPPGWVILETGSGANAQYTASDGSAGGGDTYSLGTVGSGERALGAINTLNAASLWGCRYVNQTGFALTGFSLSYAGEQWRLNGQQRADRLVVEYSTDATGLGNGTWTTVPALEFVSPTTLAPTVGALDGNAEANRRVISAEVQGVAVPIGAAVWVRFRDVDIIGADDALAADDVSFTPRGVPIEVSVAGATVAEGNAGATTTATFLVSLSRPAGPAGVSFDIATLDGSARSSGGGSGPNDDFVPRSLASHAIPFGQQTFSFQVTIRGDDAPEATENFSVAIDNAVGAAIANGFATGFITNDDGPATRIGVVQGAGEVSRSEGQVVTVRGVVTARRAGGFFLQEPDAAADGDPATSDGLFVQTSLTPPAGAVVGNLVDVTGRVQEFAPGGASDPFTPTFTQLTGSPSVAVVSTGQALPGAVEITGAVAGPGSPEGALERLEGMRVRVASLTVVGPTGGSIPDVTGVAASNGLFQGVVTGVARPVREPGIPATDPLPAGAPCCVPRFDGNGERIGVDSDGQTGGVARDFPAGAVVTGVVGVLDYASRTYTVLQDPATPLVASGGVSAAAASAPSDDEATVGSIDLARLFDDADAPGVSDPVLPSAVFAARVAKAATAIRVSMHAPDLVIVEQVENLATLTAIAQRIGADAAQASQPDPAYAAYAGASNDPLGFGVGVLVKTRAVNQGTQSRARVSGVSVSSVGQAAEFVNAANGAVERVFQWPPVLVTGRVNFEDGRGPEPGVSGLPLAVIGVNLRSATSIDSLTLGAAARESRAAQAEFLAATVAARHAADADEATVVIGQFNASPFSDGYVDVVGTAMGAPPATDAAVRPTPDLLTPDLEDAVLLAAPEERYTAVSNGNAQLLQQALVSEGLLGKADSLRVGFARINADLPLVARNVPGVPDRIGDQDPVVVYLGLGPEQPGGGCRADFDRLNGVDVLDIFAYLSAWFAGLARADMDASGRVDVLDIFVFLSEWFAGC